jgi:uncharacterized lipoprotein YbaY
VTSIGSTSTRRDRVLLACGIAAPTLYIASDVIASLRWEGYSYRDQTVSELNAIGAPTRSLTIVLLLMSYSVLIAFGVGVWRSARGDRRLRVAGGAVVMLGAQALWAVPFASMHVREAEESLSDTLHLVDGGIAGILTLLIIGLGASALGKGFRAYSIATVVVAIAFSAWSGMDGARMADDLATPWLGIKERVAAYSLQLWMALFAIALLQLRHRRTVISGTVSYREGVAMPPGAVLTISLLDTSRADAPSELVAEVVLDDPGNGPIDFELAYDPAVIDDRHTYAVRTTIEVDGALRWTSTSAHLVVTNGQPTRVEVPLTRVSA